MNTEMLADSGGLKSLKADCANCFGLCCVALPFAASSDFAVDKPAGKPCVNLRGDSLCGIHDRLRDSGYQGCTVFDCNGAGQKVSQRTLGGIDWRSDAGIAETMREAFPVMRLLHELLAYLVESRQRLERLGVPANASPLKDEETPDAVARYLHDVDRLLTETETLTLLEAVQLGVLDAGAQRARVGETLLGVSELIRSSAGKASRTTSSQTASPQPTAAAAKRAAKLRTRGRGADLIGADLAATDLRFVNLRGAYLIAARLRGADLRWADLIGADLRDADLRDADLSESLFVTQMQLNAAKGNVATRIPQGLQRPTHWHPVAVTIATRRPSH